MKPCWARRGPRTWSRAREGPRPSLGVPGSGRRGEAVLGTASPRTCKEAREWLLARSGFPRGGTSARAPARSAARRPSGPSGAARARCRAAGAARRDERVVGAALVVVDPVDGRASCSSSKANTARACARRSRPLERARDGVDADDEVLEVRRRAASSSGSRTRRRRSRSWCRSRFAGAPHDLLGVLTIWSKSAVASGWNTIPAGRGGSSSS